MTDKFEYALYGLILFFIGFLVLLFVVSYYEYKEASESEFVTIKQINMLPDGKLIKSKVTIEKQIKYWQTCAKVCTYHYIYLISDSTGIALAESSFELEGNVVIYGRINGINNNLKYINVNGKIYNE